MEVKTFELTLIKENFVPLLSNVIGKETMKKNMIRNGLMTTGLFPRNCNVVDYLKCV